MTETKAPAGRRRAVEAARRVAEETLEKLEQERHAYSGSRFPPKSLSASV